MEIGLIFALVGGVVFAGSLVFVRRGVYWAGESFTSVLIQVFVGVPFFAVAVFITGEWGKLWSLSWQGFLLLGLAGIVHFVFGRFLSYTAVRLIGVNKVTPLLMTSPFYTLIFGFVFLSETLTITLILGVLCIFAGAILVGVERKSVSGQKPRWFSGTEFRGILAALGGALCWGTSPVLIRPAVAEIGSPSAAAFVSYMTATIILLFFLSGQRVRTQLVQLRPSGALIPLLIGAILVSVGHLLNYAALNYSPASIVTPLVSTSTLFVFLFSFLLNRHIEVFTGKVIIGMIATVAGVFLIFYF